MFRHCLNLVKYVSPVKVYSVNCRQLCELIKNDKFKENVIWKALRSKASKVQLERYESILEEFTELQQIEKENDTSLRDLIKQDFKKLTIKLQDLENEIIDNLVEDEYTNADEILLELKPGVGGQESMLFARELFQIYIKYIKYQDWLLLSVEDDFTEIGGLKYAFLSIRGPNVFKYFRHEAGVHRVQRIPKTEKSGRIHTSTAAVNVLPILQKDPRFHINPKDIKIETTTSSAPGGQHVNKTETCVRITHLPTNLMVICQETRSQAQNKQTALDRLKNLLLRREYEKEVQNFLKIKKNQTGDLGRSEKIRTYNFVQDRITDHRLNENFYNIKEFVKGDPNHLHKIITKCEQKRKEIMLKNILQL